MLEFLFYNRQAVPKYRISAFWNQSLIFVPMSMFNKTAYHHLVPSYDHPSPNTPTKSLRMCHVPPPHQPKIIKKTSVCILYNQNNIENKLKHVQRVSIYRSVFFLFCLIYSFYLCPSLFCTSLTNVSTNFINYSIFRMQDIIVLKVWKLLDNIFQKL